MDDPGPKTYEFRIEGHLDDHWAPWLGDFMITRHPDGTTTLTGTIADQPQLHGVLAALRDSGTTLLSVKTTEPRVRDAEGRRST